MGNNKKYSRTLIYLLSVGINLFVLIPLELYITPLIILLGGSYLFYILLSIVSLGLGFLFKLLLEKSNTKNKDFIVFPMILSTVALFYFGFLKTMETLYSSIAAKMSAPVFPESPSVFLLRNFPNTDLAFVLFLIFFNFSFLYKYLKVSERNYFYFLLYAIPIILYFGISLAINVFIEPL